MVGVAVLISNIIIGFVMEDGDQPYAMMRWKTAPLRSSILGFVMLFL